MTEPKPFVLFVDPGKGDIHEEVLKLMTAITSELKVMCLTLTNAFGAEANFKVLHRGNIAQYQAQMELGVSTSKALEGRQDFLAESVYEVIARGCENRPDLEASQIHDPQILAETLFQELAIIRGQDMLPEHVEGVTKCLKKIRQALSPHPTYIVQTYPQWNRPVASKVSFLADASSPDQDASEPNPPLPPDQIDLFETRQLGSDSTEFVSNPSADPNEKSTIGGQARPKGDLPRGPALVPILEPLELTMEPQYVSSHGRIQINFHRGRNRTPVAMSSEFPGPLIDRLKLLLGDPIRVMADVNFSKDGRIKIISFLEDLIPDPE